MKIINSSFSSSKLKFVVSIGIFDGLHLGHQFIIKKTIDRAKKMGVKSLIITFWPNPKEILNKDNLFGGYIMSLDEKKKILESLGLDYLLILKTDQRLVVTDGSQFIERLVKKVKITELIVGKGFRFGHKRLWGSKHLENLSQKLNFKLNLIQKVLLKDDIISSSLIRSLVKVGDFPRVNKLLGRNYLFESKVVRGRGVGQELGFATANLEIKKFVIPNRGVYAVRVFIGKKNYLGALNIGIRPTIRKQKKPLIEVHIVNFRKDILNKKINISFLKKIRNEFKFSSKNLLKRAISQDVTFVTSRYSTLP